MFFWAWPWDCWAWLDCAFFISFADCLQAVLGAPHLGSGPLHVLLGLGLLLLGLGGLGHLVEPVGQGLGALGHLLGLLRRVVELRLLLLGEAVLELLELRAGLLQAVEGLLLVPAGLFGLVLLQALLGLLGLLGRLVGLLSGVLERFRVRGAVARLGRVLHPVRQFLGLLVDLVLLLLELGGLRGPGLVGRILDLLERVAGLLEVLDRPLLVPPGEIQGPLVQLLPRGVLRVVRLDERLEDLLPGLLREGLLVEEVVPERPGAVVQLLLLLLEALRIRLLGRRLGFAGVLRRALLVLDRLGELGQGLVERFLGGILVLEGLLGLLLAFDEVVQLPRQLGHIPEILGFGGVELLLRRLLVGLQLLDLLDRLVDLLHQVVGLAGLGLVPELLLLLDQVGQVLPDLLEVLLALLVEVVGLLLDLLLLLLDLIELLERLLDRLHLLLGLFGVEAVLEEGEQGIERLGDVLPGFQGLFHSVRVEMFDDGPDVHSHPVLPELLEAVLELLGVVLLVLLAELVDELGHLGLEFLDVRLDAELAVLDRLSIAAGVLREERAAKRGREGRREECTHTGLLFTAAGSS